MKRTLCYLYLIFAYSTVFSQVPAWEWAKTGSTHGVEGYLTAIDKNEYIYAAVLNADSAAVIRFGSVSVANPMHYINPVIVKYDSSGNALWALPLQGNSKLIGITTDQQNNLWLFGVIFDSIQIGAYSFSSTAHEYYIAKVSPSGSVIQAIKDGGNWNPGGWYGMSGGIKADMDGNIYVSSNFLGSSINIGAFTLLNTDTSGRTGDVFVAKYSQGESAALHAVWAKNIGGIKDDEVKGFALSKEGYSYIAGIFFSPAITLGTHTITNAASHMVMYLAKFDPNGTPAWIESSGSHIGKPAAIDLDNAENIYITGAYNDTLPIGNATIYNPVYGANLFLAKLDSADNMLWYKNATLPPGSFSYAPFATALGVATDECDNVWINGSMGSGIDRAFYIMLDSNRIDTASGTNTFIPRHTQDPGFVAGFTSSGKFINGRALQSGFDDPNGMVCGSGGALYLISDFVNGYLITKNDTSIDTSNNEYFFIAKYKYGNSNCYRTGIENITPSGSLRLFPNPATEQCTLLTDGQLPDGTSVVLYDILGRPVKKYSLSANNTQLALGDIKPGVYQVSIAGYHYIASLKLVVIK